MSTSSPAATITAVRDRRVTVGRWLLAVCALAAAGAAVSAVPAVTAAGDATLLVETWRLTGLVVFAGIFALLARSPRALPGLFELVIAHKAAMTIAALVATSADGAKEIALADGSVTAVLLAAYVLTRRSPRRVG